MALIGYSTEINIKGNGNEMNELMFGILSLILYIVGVFGLIGLAVRCYIEENKTEVK